MNRINNWIATATPLKFWGPLATALLGAVLLRLLMQ